MTPQQKFLICSSGDWAIVGSLLASSLAAQQRDTVVERIADEGRERSKVKSLPRGIGSDHDAFLAAGVPGFFWQQAGRANYTFTHHTRNDTYAAAIPEYQQHSATAIDRAPVECMIVIRREGREVTRPIRFTE